MCTNNPFTLFQKSATGVFGKKVTAFGSLGPAPKEDKRGPEKGMGVGG
jgi:hypothetical protein